MKEVHVISVQVFIEVGVQMAVIHVVTLYITAWYVNSEEGILKGI
jgi:hypothetical protein